MLMLTGLSLLFYDSWPGKYLIILEGGSHNRGLLHHIFAIVLIATCIFHVFYITFSRKGHYEIFNLRFTKKDHKNFILNIKYNFGFNKQKPDGIFNTSRKIHYWLVVSGCIIMIMTGTILLLKVFGFGMIFPKWIWDITITLHSNQAIMIFLVLFLWHIYNVLMARGFRGLVYGKNTVVKNENPGY
jgi:cytochrome b subunit of formate dehydrogenase